MIGKAPTVFPEMPDRRRPVLAVDELREVLGNCHSVSTNRFGRSAPNLDLEDHLHCEIERIANRSPSTKPPDYRLRDEFYEATASNTPPQILED